MHQNESTEDERSVSLMRYVCGRVLSAADERLCDRELREKALIRYMVDQSVGRSGVKLSEHDLDKVVSDLHEGWKKDYENVI